VVNVRPHRRRIRTVYSYSRAGANVHAPLNAYSLGAPESTFPSASRPVQPFFAQLTAQLTAQRIRGFTTMRYINLRFTYLLTYLLTASFFILQWAVSFSPENCPFARKIWIPSTMVPLAHASRQPKQHFDRFSRFCRVAPDRPRDRA